MDFKNISSFFIQFILYLFAFLFIFFVIYRSYIYCFGIDPHPCMSDKCIQKRLHESIPS